MNVDMCVRRRFRAWGKPFSTAVSRESIIPTTASTADNIMPTDIKQEGNFTARSLVLVLTHSQYSKVRCINGTSYTG